MKIILHLPSRRIAAFSLILLAASILLPRLSSAQTRPIGAGALVLDDNFGHTITIESPQPGDPGYTTWAAGGPIHWHVPIPPWMDATMGFVLTGPATAGPIQMLTWDPPSPAGTGGAQGTWRPLDVSSVLTTSGFVSGTGTSGHLAGFTGTSSIGNTDLTGDVTTSGSTATTISTVGAAGVAAGSHIVTAVNSNAATGVFTAAHGGTGQSSYSTGDVLYAAGSSTLSKLSVGTQDQVLTVSGRIPSWANSGATITYATSTSTVATNLIQFTPAPSSTYIRISNTSGGTINITGMNSSGVPDGRLLTIVNISASSLETIQILDHNPASLAADQFDLPGALPIVLSQNGAATFLYDLSRQKWELIATN